MLTGDGRMAEKKKEYLIGDVSRIVGMSRDALRFYEKDVYKRQVPYCRIYGSGHGRIL